MISDRLLFSDNAESGTLDTLKIDRGFLSESNNSMRTEKSFDW